MKLMVVGDTHGSSESIFRKARLAQVHKADKMMVVGDFGMWPGKGGRRFLDNCQYAADQFGVDIYALPGNHEDHDQWNKWLTHFDKDDDGFTYVRSGVKISPKVHNWKWDGKRFYICGGAVSIDRQWRIPGESYWPNETFSEDNLSSVQKYKGPDIDYLFTHDCSNYTPWGFKLVPDPDSQSNRQRIDKAIMALRPKQMFHGHMHTKYEWSNVYNNADHPTKTYGLDMNDELWSWGILDTETDKFTWGPQIS